ncbi:DUF1287 domain-containing protein [Clostridium sp. LBM24168]
MRKKFFIVFLVFICLAIVGLEFFTHKNMFYSKNAARIKNKNMTDNKNNETIDEKLKKVIVLKNSDKDKDGIKDQEDILLGARKEAHKKVKYKSGYYIGGYPPENEGVCTDLVWRAFRNAGYDLKGMVR